MSDPYRFAQPQSGSEPRRDDTPSTQGRYAVRALLWLLIIVGAAANATTSLGGFHPLISVAFGLLTVLGIVLLVVHHLRNRR
ncbi:hypothetical protein [Streptomonospora salina]|uniref:Fatty acid desaturase n=1 Tax=Streptomonospora salina TaxID=104205 RepID=A0A841EKL3_9ACTN|nr:hypothetical protein [Streptomonospora salina]MBB5999951.1 fatty acid desaturase [Streptomonospora salina]